MPYSGLTPELTSVRAIADLAPWGRLVPKPSGGEGRIPKLVNSSGPGPYRFFGSRED